MRRLFILRPQPAANHSVERASALGMEATALPLFEVRALEWRAPDPGEFDAVLLTSANAIRHGGAKLEAFRHLAVHAVGEASATAARGAGFGSISAGTSDVTALLARLAPGLRLFHPCGRDRQKQPSAQNLTSVAVYASEAVPLPAGFEAIAGGLVAVHSPRAGARLAELADEARLDRKSVRIAAISEAAASATGAGWGVVMSSPVPTDAGLLELAARLCEKPRQR